MPIVYDFDSANCMHPEGVFHRCITVEILHISLDLMEG